MDRDSTYKTYIICLFFFSIFQTFLKVTITRFCLLNKNATAGKSISTAARCHIIVLLNSHFLSHPLFCQGKKANPKKFTFKLSSMNSFQLMCNSCLSHRSRKKSERTLSKITPSRHIPTTLFFFSVSKMSSERGKGG